MLKGVEAREEEEEELKMPALACIFFPLCVNEWRRRNKNASPFKCPSQFLRVHPREKMALTSSVTIRAADRDTFVSQGLGVYHIGKYICTHGTSQHQDYTSTQFFSRLG